MDFKDKVKAVRLKVMMSQHDFAKELGLAYCTINRWEQGKNEPNFKAQRIFYEYCQKKGITFDE
jgi:DNA-binding transcriptional regulator YiaG